MRGLLRRSLLVAAAAGTLLSPLLAAPALAGTTTIGITVITTGTVTEHQFLGGVAAEFTDSANASPVASDYGASFDWGDGTVFSTSAGTATITCAAATCNVSVNGHSYAEEGVYTVQVFVYPTGAIATAAARTGTLTATDADSFTGTGTAVSGLASTALSGVQTASFVNADSVSTAADFEATIDWGDGTAVAGGTVAAAGGSTFTVSGSHTYSAAGSYTITTSIDEPAPGTASASVTATATILTAQAISFTAPASGTVGGSATLSAAGGASGNPVVFTLDPSTTNSACSLSGTNGSTVSYQNPGSCVIDANQAAGGLYAAAPQASGSIPVVAPAPASTVVTLTANPAGGSIAERAVVLTAAVSSVGAPTGSVSFTADGNALRGCAGVPLVSGSAVCTTSELPIGASTIDAAYSGDAGHSSGVASLTYSVGPVPTVSKPSIRARLSSAHPVNALGWYRSPVRVLFTCTTHGSPLSAPGCPRPVTLRANGLGRSVTRTIHAADGGSASVTVSGLNIDRTPPRVQIKGARAGHTYAAPGPRNVRCVAHDRISGLAGALCRVSIHRHGTRATITATARDRAGNVRRVTIHIRLRR